MNAYNVTTILNFASGGTVDTVSVRELKARLSHYLRRVRQGRRIVVTARRRPVAILGPTVGGPEDERLDTMLRDGTAAWGGGVPRGSSHPARVVGAPVAAAVVEDRR
ncbi:MAG: type II toxin-antitoxin system prevent-host-death family antitoxin [Armatimonadota bacterium]|nr:type II toxin-antitoxin system prevent-host-death family antitoxin [Armatimonadota bacterium]